MRHEGIDQLAALIHHAYLFWDSGSRVVSIDAEELGGLLGDGADPAAEATAEPFPARYVQVPERRVWARPVEGEPFEPLDGCFLDPAPDGGLRVLAVFGLRPERAGFTVVEAQDRMLARVVAPVVSRHVAARLAAAGVRLLPGTTLARLEGAGGGRPRRDQP